MPRLRSARHRFGFCLALGLALLSACAGSERRVLEPHEIVLAFSRALNEGKLDEAYLLMSEEYRQRVSLEEWRERLGGNLDEANELSHKLSRVRGPADEIAVLRYGDGNELVLRKDGERWLIASEVSIFYDQSTPRAALVTFVHAMERRRYDVVIRLVPEADKEGMTTERMEAAWSGESREEVEQMLESLRAHLDNPIEIVGNHATMPYGHRSRVQFVREDGVWKIEDPR